MQDRLRTRGRKLAVESLESRAVLSANPILDAAPIPAAPDHGVLGCPVVLAAPESLGDSAVNGNTGAEGEPISFSRPYGPAYPALVDTVMALRVAPSPTIASRLARPAMVEDGPEGEPPAPGDPPVGEVPVIENYRAVCTGYHEWTVMGEVGYSNPVGLVVKLNGLLDNVTVPVGADSFFEYTHVYEQGTMGEVTAQAFTPTGVFSNLESVYIMVD
ncbi:MAG: hypothetical protein FJ297_00510 [Planctomycetes bacterium]|nr:hypothetical protein [Planctomycetota bacterium]